jgi:hypothetical protein
VEVFVNARWHSSLLVLVSLFALGLMAVLATPSNSSAQQPKLDIKAFAGVSVTRFVARFETERFREGYLGWQMGFGPRLRKRQWFAEVLLSFNRWAFRSPAERATFQVNSFQLPLNAGYIPFKSPYFKLFLYGGLVNQFNTRVLERQDDGPTYGHKPRDRGLPIYQALARFGVNADLAMFNVDFNYSIGLNSATKTTHRTNSHQLQLNVAYLF